LIYSDGQVERYLRKIGYGEPLGTTGKTLEGLQTAHLRHIPYENLDILNQIPLALDAESLFSKMILRPRGGYCFELNGLFSNLLKSLGFDVTNLAGRFIDAEGPPQMRRHRILKVRTAEGAYICDVGVRSESPRRSLRFVEGLVQSDGISEYKFEGDPFYGHILWQKEAGKAWKKMYGFTQEPQLDLDYVMPSFFCERHPLSPFISFNKISIFTDTANINIVDNVLIFYENGKIQRQIELKTKDELDDALKSHFNIDASR